MSEINSILKRLEGTKEKDVLCLMEEAYKTIDDKQNKWFEKGKFHCVEGCGECCRNFEPDILECEALYMAAWIIENCPDVALKVADGNFPYPNNNGCLFWDEFNQYHCRIYNGRGCICRIFGASSFIDKHGEPVWKPCKFYPIEKLEEHNPPLSHKQYSRNELLEIFGTTAPLMSNLMEPVININPDEKKTELIRNILPQTIKKLLWIMQMNGND